jgi:hypothetical protein
MRIVPFLLFPLAALAACSAKSSSAPATSDGGDDGGNPISFTYTPQGCNYSYAAPSILGFTDFALDDTGTVDPTNGKPQRVRVGLGGGTDKGQAGYADPTTSAAFTWETTESNHGAKVKIGTSATALTDVHAGYVFTTQPGSLDAGMATHLHEVHVCGLKPGTQYFYEVGGGPMGSEVWSATQTFTTVPATGKVTVGILGDARDKMTTWQAVHLRMRDAGVAMQLIGGDIVDTGQSEQEFHDWLDAIWHDPNGATKFLTLGQQMIVPIAGNHEVETSDFYGNFAIPGTGVYAETFASFDVGSAHFVVWDDSPTGNALSGGGTATDEVTAQLTWLDKDLNAANADRADHPFIVFIAHRGLFSTSMHAKDDDVTSVRGAVVPILDKYSVDIVFNGHDHEYERSKPLKAGNPPNGAPVVGTGTTYVICAGAGADPYAVGSAMASYSQIQVAFGGTTKYIGTYGLLTLDAHTLTFKAYGLKASGTMVATDDVIDTVTLTH